MPLIFEGIYGDFSMRNGSIHMTFARRTKEEMSAGHLNRGLYYLSSDSMPGFQDKWQSIYGGNNYELPITSIDEFLIDEVSEPGDKYVNPSLAITESKTMHFIAPVMRASKPINFHYIKRKDESTVSKYWFGDDLRIRNVAGRMLTIGDTVFLIILYFGRLRIFITPAGTNNFQPVYYNPQSPAYMTAKTKLWKEKDGNQIKYHLFVAAMRMTDRRSDRQPIEVLHFLLYV